MDRLQKLQQIRHLIQSDMILLAQEHLDELIAYERGEIKDIPVKLHDDVADTLSPEEIITQDQAGLWNRRRVDPDRDDDQ